MEIGVAGAGFSGAVLARELAAAGHHVTVHETEHHVGGHCHTERDPDTGVLVHVHGPHIFHTSDERVWAYVRRFAEMVPFVHRARTTVEGRVYSLPVNLLTINQLFGAAFTPEEARAVIAAEVDTTIGEPANFEEQALKTVGRRVYEAFFAGYTRKQWGRDPRDLPASVFSRLPVRFSSDDSYFDDRYQAIPRDGYTALVERILDHPSIDVLLGSPLDPTDRAAYDHTIWTGPLDAWWDHEHGSLGYRTLDFEVFRSDGDHQGGAVMNYGDVDVPYTRVTEHKHFAPWEQHARTVCSREYSRAAGPDDVPYYPMRLESDERVLARYVDAAHREERVTFVGRLGTYRYLDMDDTISEALVAADAMVAAIRTGAPIPTFVVR